MTTLTQKMVALEEQLASQNELVLASLSLVNDALGLVNTNLETLNSNQSINAQRLLQALSMIDPCKPCPTPAIAVPPLDVTPRTANTEHCQRMQALIFTLKAAMVKFDVLSSFSIGFTTSLFTDAYNEVLTELGVDTTVALPSFPELASLVANAIGYVAGNILIGGTLQGYFNELIQEPMLSALYAATTAEEGKAAYEAVIDAGTAPGYAKALMKSIAYAALFNTYYDPSIEVGAGTFDGGICEPEPECITVTTPTDVGTVNLGGYDRINIGDLPFYSRFQDEMTITPSVHAIIGVSGFSYVDMPAGTTHLWEDVKTIFPTFIDPWDNVHGWTCEFCNLAPE